MSPEAQRTAIAEACGWTGFHKESHAAITYLWGYDSEFEHPKTRRIVPDYLNDLNDMHEAERVILINYGTWTSYVAELKIQSAKHGLPHFHLPAAQRAEAFLRTLNLWKEDA